MPHVLLSIHVYNRRKIHGDSSLRNYLDSNDKKQKSSVCLLDEPKFTNKFLGMVESSKHKTQNTRFDIP